MRSFWKKILPFTLVATLLTSCSSSSDNTTQNSTTTNSSSSSSTSITPAFDTSTEKLRILATTFPEYDWVREILGDQLDRFEVVQVMDNGVDLHSYNPSVNDIIAIGSADLFIHIGGTSDTWVDGVLEQKTNANLVELNLLESLGDNTLESEEFYYGEDDGHDDHDHEEEDSHDDHDHDDHDHEEEDSHDDHDHEEEDSHDDHDHDEHEEEDSHDDHDHDHEDGHSHDDEHIWLSLRNAQQLATVIADSIIQLDPDNKDIYTANLAAYIEKLDGLDQQYEEMVTNAARNVIVVADRFPFAYLASDYNLEYYAAFSGCSAETEASFDLIVSLSDKVNTFDLTHVITTETGNEIADTVVASTHAKNQEVVALDSMQSTTSKSPDTYLTIMEKNLSVLETILN